MSAWLNSWGLSWGNSWGQQSQLEEPIAGYNVEHESEEELILFAKVITQIIEGDL